MLLSSLGEEKFPKKISAALPVGGAFHGALHGTAVEDVHDDNLVPVIRKPRGCVAAEISEERIVAVSHPVFSGAQAALRKTNVSN